MQETGTPATWKVEVGKDNAWLDEEKNQNEREKIGAVQREPNELFFNMNLSSTKWQKFGYVFCAYGGFLINYKTKVGFD